MSDNLQSTLDRLRAHREQHTSDAENRLAEAAQRDAAARNKLPVGTRVFDIETGLDGVVDDAGNLQQLNGANMAIRVADGSRLLRRADQLIVRPSPPTVER